MYCACQPKQGKGCHPIKLLIKLSGASLGRDPGPTLALALPLPLTLTLTLTLNLTLTLTLTLNLALTLTLTLTLILILTLILTLTLTLTLLRGETRPGPSARVMIPVRHVGCQGSFAICFEAKHHHCATHCDVRRGGHLMGGSHISHSYTYHSVNDRGMARCDGEG